MKRILLLGAGGFIGTHLADALERRTEYIVTGVDINDEKLQEANSTIRYTHLDIRKDKDELKELIKSHDVIVNLIAIANPGMYIKDPIQTFQLDFLENLFVVDKCVEFGKRLIQFSTSEVYGKSPSIYVPDRKFEFNEDDSDFILGPINKHRWIYACSKQLLERIIHAYGLKNQLDYSIIRPFNYVGPRIDFLPSEGEGVPRVFSFFMDALIYQKPMYLVNGGSQKRCYTDIRDATDAHVLIIDNPDNSCFQQIYNIGFVENEVEIRQFAEIMQDIYQREYSGDRSPLVEISGSEFYGEGYEDSDRRLPVNKKIVALGWSPKYRIRQTLEYTMSYYIKRHEGKYAVKEM